MRKPLSYSLIIVLFLAWIVPGLVGRDPWKADEPYTFGLVNHIVKTGDWIVPTLAGEPFMEKPPLYFVTAAAFTGFFSPWLESHDAARMANGLYMLLALLFASLTARELFSKEHAETAALILMGCAALQVTAHKLITDVALLSGFAMALYGLALSRRRSVLGGLWLGMGTGIGFMSKGLLAPGVIGMTAFLLPLLFSAWRKKYYFLSLLVGLAAALPWLAVWPYALYQRSPDLFWEWLWIQNLGRFLGFVDLTAPEARGFYVLNLPWMTLPALPLAFWALWRSRRSWREHPAFQIPLVSFLVMFIVLSVSASRRSLYALPMLLPLSVIAADGIHVLSRSAQKRIGRFAIVFFGLISGLLWIGWLIMAGGYPTIAAEQLRHLQADYTPSFNYLQAAIAAAYTLAWLFLVTRLTRSSRHSAAVNWTAGTVLTWSLIMTLWLPLLDARTSYRTTFTSLRESMPGQYRCISSQGLGESERAMLEYFSGVLTRRVEVNGPGDCDLLLVESGNVLRDPVNGPAWQLLWEGKRPGEHRSEIFRLFQRSAANGALHTD